MEKICWLCYWRWMHKECVYQEITPSEKTREESPETSGDFPAVLGRTKEFEIRPDEHNEAKELKVAAQQIERAGMMDPERSRKMKKMIAIAERRSGTESRLDKELHVPYVIPNDVRHGMKLRRHY